jgi:hypothetical protein
MALLHFGAIAPNVASLQTSVVAPRSVAAWHKKLKKLPNVRNKDPKLPFQVLIRVRQDVYPLDQITEVY